MDVVIKIPSSEFDQELFERIKAFLKGKPADITIAVKDNSSLRFPPESEGEYWNRLNKSITDIQEGKGTTFTMQELEAFITQ